VVPLQRSLRLLVAIRLIVLATVVLSCLLIQAATGFAIPLRAIYLVAALGVVVTAAAVLAGRVLSPTTQAYLQLSGDALIITGLVFVSGGADSVFTFAYLILIGTAAYLLDLRGSLLLASVSSLLYGLLIEFDFYDVLPVSPFSLRPEWSHPNRLLPMAVNIFGFYASALLFARIFGSLQVARREADARRRELDRVRALHADIIASMSSGLATIDATGLLTMLNPAGAAILRCPMPAGGRTVSDLGLLSENDWRRLVNRLAGEAAPRGEAILAGPPSERSVGYSLHTLKGSEDYLMLFQDLTEMKRLEREARAREKLAAVGALAAGIAHEIRNPLASISGSAQLLATEMRAGSSERRLVEIMTAESKRLSNILEDFLHYARPRERRVEEFDVAASLSEAMDLFAHSDEVTSGHRLELDVVPAHSSLAGDADQIRQIFWNVARNAVTAMPAGGGLTVTGRESGAWYTIIFRDTGRGMTPEERELLFQPFATAFDGGTGLGMAIVRRLVDEHAGVIDVTTGQGLGTSIEIRLPRAASEKKENPAA
jgi:two-component system sensor histidine kinase PilS (NtrC family)